MRERSFQTNGNCMITFLKNLFGGADKSAAEPGMVKADGVEYKGFVITPSPIVEGSQYRTCGTISHTAEDGQVRQSQYIRADNHSSEQQAIDHAISKGKQVIDERGESLFASERC